MGIFDNFRKKIKDNGENPKEGKENKKSAYDKKLQEAGTLTRILGDSDTEGLFGGYQTNGYVQNNNVYIENKLKKIYPAFSSKGLAEVIKELFLALNRAGSLSELKPELVPYVVSDFYFGNVPNLNIERFIACYLNLFKRVDNIEYMYACISFFERGASEETGLTRYFVKLKRPTQYKTIEGRNIKFIACPKCGGLVYFRNKDEEQCIRCDESVSFKEYGWQLYEVEKITEDTPIETMVTL